MATRKIMRLHRIAFAFAALLFAGFGVTAAARPQPAPSASPVTDYIVGPQDVLTITSYDQADLSGKFAVEADGTFTYPLIGRFKAGGLTLRATEEGLKKRLKDDGYFNNPQITVAVEQYRSQKVFVVGEVRSPGAYALQQRTTTVLQALSLAGGVTDRGSTSRIRIVRIVDGQKKELRVTLGDVIKAGDTIIVSERFL